ncbi:MAG: hypothetical protein EBS48_02815 [Actinobacteria bacterium]|nr:hypothetical protein [Actinomycetota bacterium]
MKTHSRFTRIAIASGLIVASGAAVLGITGFASAELAGNNDQAAVVAPAAGSADDTDVANAQSVEGVAPAHDGGPRASVSAVNVAKVLGLTEEELRTELQTKSFVTIAGEKKVDIAKVKEALTADAKAHLDAEVASGEHTQAEADARLAAFTANLDAFVNAVRPAKGMGGRHGGAPFATEGRPHPGRGRREDRRVQGQPGLDGEQRASRRWTRRGRQGNGWPSRRSSRPR